MPKPREVVLFDGSIKYKCCECGYEVDSSGFCREGSLPCHYCPPESCESCGRGFCDQSC